MTKKFFFLFILICTIQVSKAQKGDLFVKAGDKGLYLEHKVAPKESFYAVGRLYNISPKSLAAYNKLDVNKGLQIDQKIRIPLTDSNFTQQGGSGTPVYYRPTDKEGLLTISNKHNGVDIAHLHWWNALSAMEVKKDAKIIIGFLQSKEMKSITIKGSPDPGVMAAPVVLTEKEKEEQEKEAEAELKAEKKKKKKRKRKKILLLL